MPQRTLFSSRANSDTSKWSGLRPSKSSARWFFCGSRSASRDRLRHSWAGRRWRVLSSWLSWCRSPNASAGSSAWFRENSWKWRTSESTPRAKRSKASNSSSCRPGSDPSSSEFLEFGVTNCPCCEDMCMSRPCRNVSGIRHLIWCQCWASSSLSCLAISWPQPSRLPRFLCSGVLLLIWLAGSIFCDRLSRDSQTFSRFFVVRHRRLTALRSAECPYSESSGSF